MIAEDISKYPPQWCVNWKRMQFADNSSVLKGLPALRKCEISSLIKMRHFAAYANHPDEISLMESFRRKPTSS